MATKTKPIKPINRDRGPGFMTFTIAHDLDTAIMQFEARHGCYPKDADEEADKYLMLGPVPEKEI